MSLGELQWPARYFALAMGVLMIRVVSLVRLTDEGMRQLETFGEVVGKVRETVTNGGSLEHVWQTAGVLTSWRS